MWHVLYLTVLWAAFAVTTTFCLIELVRDITKLAAWLRARRQGVRR